MRSSPPHGHPLAGEVGLPEGKSGVSIRLPGHPHIDAGRRVERGDLVPADSAQRRRQCDARFEADVDAEIEMVICLGDRVADKADQRIGIARFPVAQRVAGPLRARW
jgi:hypothetical protein